MLTVTCIQPKSAFGAIIRTQGIKLKRERIPEASEEKGSQSLPVHKVVLVSQVRTTKEFWLIHVYFL